MARGRPRGSAHDLEQRRRHAVALLRAGAPPASVARQLGVGRTAVYLWRRQAGASPDGVAAKPHPGRRPRLTPGQLAELDVSLAQGARYCSHPTERWAARRLAGVIGWMFGVRYHEGHARRLLGRMSRRGGTSHPVPVVYDEPAEGLGDEGGKMTAFLPGTKARCPRERRLKAAGSPLSRPGTAPRSRTLPPGPPRPGGVGRPGA